MSTIYKYVLPTESRVVLDMPAGACLLAVQAQNDVPTLWARVDPKRSTEKRVFRLYGTGATIDDSEHPSYVGTVQHGTHVAHVFEVEE